MITYVEAPGEWDGPDPAVFLAGGITDCEDWQAEARLLLPGVVVLNPRRANFPIHDPAAGPEQIAWEFRHLQRASVILFWFAAGPSPQPIALYELGRYAALGWPLAVGVERGYTRALDVREQLRLARSDLRVVEQLADVCAIALAMLAMAQ